MIKANELRIGNWVKGMYGTIVRANEISRLNVKIDEHDDKYPSIQNIEPIPLTEEWLVKSNWKRLDKYTFTLNGLFIYKRKRGFVTGSKKRETLLESVHDLQNWYYYNNNKEELEIK